MGFYLWASKEQMDFFVGLKFFFGGGGFKVGFFVDFKGADGDFCGLKGADGVFWWASKEQMFFLWSSREQMGVLVVCFKGADGFLEGFMFFDNSQPPPQYMHPDHSKVIT